MRHFKESFVVFFSVATCTVSGANEGEIFCEKSGFAKKQCNLNECCFWQGNKCWYGEGDCGDGNGDGDGDGCSGGKDKGETFCEKSGFEKEQCNNNDCCIWEGNLNNGKCWYDGDGGGNDDGGGGNDDGDGVRGVILPGVVGLVNGAVVWSNPPRSWGKTHCKKVTTVFGAAVCVTKKAWQKRDKINHIVNVYYQLLDNDADGLPDDPAVLSELVDGGYLLIIPGKESENFNKLPDHWRGQPSTAQEAVINSCGTPNNRGANSAVRSTWEAAVDTSGSSCNSERDATFEEVLHLITEAALTIYPDLWGDDYSSDAGAALEAANGDCGWGYSKDYVDPSKNGKCTGYYAYDDRTCTKECIVVEGIYWASLSYVGGLYTLDQADSIKNEWLMGTPDEGMMVLPKSVDNAISLKKGSPALYELVSDTTSEGHAWLPAVMTDGAYMGVPVKEKCTDEEAAVKWMYRKKRVKIKGTCGSLEEDTETNIAKVCKKSQPKKKCMCVCAA